MELLVLNTKFETVAFIDSFESHIWSDRYNERGDFELTFAMDSNILEFLKEDYYLVSSESEHAMIIEDIAVDSDIEDGNMLIVTGRSLESILERRIVWGQKVLKGNLQNGVKTLINEAIISPTDANRKIDNFIFEESTDKRITDLTLDAQYYGEDLYSVIEGLCQEHEIGFKIVLNDNNQFVFSLYVGEDKSYRQTTNPYVVFSPEFDNIITSNYFMSKATLKNVALVAGEGEGSSRKTATVGSGSGLNRREMLVEARDISTDTDGGTLSSSEYKKQLETAGKKALSENNVTTAFEGEVETTQLFVYGEDFFIGDIVQIADAYGHEEQVYISEIVISQDENGFSIRPTFKSITETEEESK